MNLQQLKYVVEVDRHKSITKAARSLFVSQPGVSTAIKELEEELKIQLFARTPAGVETTEIGRAFVRDAIDVLQKAEILGKRYSREGDVAPRTLRVAGPPADSSLWAMIASINRLRADESFRLSYINQLVFDVIDSVEKGAVDLGIISFKGDYSKIVDTILAQKKLEFHLIAQYPLCLAVAKDHPLATAEHIKYETLIQYPLIYMDSDFHDNTLQFMAHAMGGEGADSPVPLKTVQVVDLYTLIKLLKETDSVSAIAAQRFAGEALQGNGIVRLHGTLGSSTERRGWIKRRDTTLSPWAQAFIGDIHDYFVKLADEGI